VFSEAHKQNFELADKTLNFQGHLNVLWGSFMALLCLSRWSDQKWCETECVALEISFQTRPIDLFEPIFLQDRDFYSDVRSFAIFGDFSQENPYHSRHGHGVHRGFWGESFHSEKCP
jgi:hypothetical protein